MKPDAAAGNAEMSTDNAKDRFDEPITDEVLRRATELGRHLKTLASRASTVQYRAHSQTLTLGIPDQPAVALHIQKYPELANLSPAELSRLTLGYGGRALCLDEIDLHISIAGLISATVPP